MYCGLAAWSLTFSLERQSPAPPPNEVDLSEVTAALAGIEETLQGVSIRTGVIVNLLENQCGDLSAPCHTIVDDQVDVFVMNRSLAVD